MAVLFVVLAGSVSAPGQTVTLKTNSQKISSTPQSGGPPGQPPVVVDVYKSEPSGTYDTGTSTSNHQMVVEIGAGKTVATFKVGTPRQFARSYATNVSLPDFSVNASAATVNWNLTTGYGFLFAISTPPGPTDQAMQVRLREDLPFLGFTTVARTVVALP